MCGHLYQCINCICWASYRSLIKCVTVECGLLISLITPINQPWLSVNESRQKPTRHNNAVTYHMPKCYIARYTIEHGRLIHIFIRGPNNLLTMIFDMALGRRKSMVHNKMTRTLDVISQSYEEQICSFLATQQFVCH